MGFRAAAAAVCKCKLEEELTKCIAPNRDNGEHELKLHCGLQMESNGGEPLNCGLVLALINFNQRRGIAFKIKIYCQFAANSIKLRLFSLFVDLGTKRSRKNTQLDMDMEQEGSLGI